MKFNIRDDAVAQLAVEMTSQVIAVIDLLIGKQVFSEEEMSAKYEAVKARLIDTIKEEPGCCGESQSCCSGGVCQMPENPSNG